MREHKTLTCGQPYVHNARVNSHLTEPCFDAKTVELFSIGYPDSGSGKGSCRLSADMLSERIDYSTVIWTHDSPDAEQHAATRNEYSPHFAERSRSVRKELKTLLTHDDIKRGAREVHGHGAAFHPFQTPDRKPSGQRRARGRGSSDANLRVLIRDSPHRSRPQRMAWLVVGRPFRGAPDGPAYRLGRLGSRSRAYLLRRMAFLHVGT